MEVRPRGRLRKPSWVMIDNIQALDAGRFREAPLGSLDNSEMAVIEQKLKPVLGVM